jgi:hypothetical protein
MLTLEGEILWGKPILADESKDGRPALRVSLTKNILGKPEFLSFFTL